MVPVLGPSAMPVLVLTGSARCAAEWFRGYGSAPRTARRARSGGGRGRHVGGAELGEAELGGLERAERLDLALGGGVVGADDAGGAEGLQCGGNGLVGDGVELGVGGGGTGVLVGVQILEEEVGEEVRLAQTIQLRAEMIQARGERAEVGEAALLPLADESEPVVDEVAGLFGQIAGECRVRDGEDEVAEGIATSAARDEGNLGSGGVLGRQIVAGDHVERVRCRLASGRVAVGEGGRIEERVGEIHPRAGEIDAMVKHRLGGGGFGGVEREGLQDSDGGAVGFGGGGEGFGRALAMKGMAAIDPRCAAGVVGGGLRGEFRRGEEGDRGVVGEDRGGERGRGGELLECIPVIEMGDGEVATGAKVGRRESTEEGNRALVGAGGFSEGCGRGLLSEGLGAGEPRGGVGRSGRVGRRHEGPTRLARRPRGQ